MKKLFATVLTMLMVLTLFGSATVSASGTWVQKGDKNTFVYIVQGLLNEKGNYKLAIDGIAGDATDKAIKGFQKNNKLTEDGKVGDQTKDRLIANVTLQMGSKGDAVKGLQQYLMSSLCNIDTSYKTAIKNAGGADGVYGTATYNAVFEFQRVNVLGKDGKVGSQTWNAIFGC